nr:class I SAM-dependent DNA methyltransferase [Helicobacter didelphidarum]
MSGLVFLKYISESFSQVYERLKREGSNTEDKDEYLAENVFFVPQSARWEMIMASAKLPTIGKTIDKAMFAIESENDSLKGILPKIYAKENLDSIALGKLIDLISNITLSDTKERSNDILGHIFEYFLGKFALSEGKNGGEFYTPKSVVQLLVSILEPFRGRVFDPCCGSGGMFVQSEEFVQEHSGKIDDIVIYGQESNQTTWKLAKMNLAIRQIDSSLVLWNSEGSFLNDAHKDLKADFIIANPPFNDSDWSGELLAEDIRFKYGTPPPSNANYAWIQHFIYHLAPKGVAGFVLAKGSLTSNTAGEGIIRRNLIESNLIDCIINLPAKLFLNTQIPACLWFIRRNRTTKDILFIDARNLGTLINRKNRILTPDDISKIASTYHSWRRGSEYSDTKGFCKAASFDEVANLGFTLTPGRYVGLEESEEEIDFEAEFARLKSELQDSMREEERLNVRIMENLSKIRA